MSITAVIFDMDGVIVRSLDCEVESWRRIFDAFGKPFSEETYKEFSGTPGAQVVRAYLKPDATDKEAAAWEEKKAEYFIECAKQFGIREIEGVRQLILGLHGNGYRLAVATGGMRKRAEETLHDLGLFSYFAAIVGAEDVERGKPDPEPFLMAAKGIGVASKECAVIEDAPNGIVGAKAAGMKCIAIATTYREDELEGADRVVHSFSEISENTFASL